MYTVIYSSEALNELEQAMDWYEEQQAGRGGKFLACIGEKLAYLRRHADQYQGVSCGNIPLFYRLPVKQEKESVICRFIFPHQQKST